MMRGSMDRQKRGGRRKRIRYKFASFYCDQSPKSTLGQSVWQFEAPAAAVIGDSLRRGCCYDSASPIDSGQMTTGIIVCRDLGSSMHFSLPLTATQDQ